MKKSFRFYLALSCSLLLFTSLHAQQSAYYDAKYISENCFDRTNGVFIHRENLYAVLKKYYPNTPLSEAVLRTNPFFNPYVPLAIALTGTPSTFTSITNAIGGLNVTNFADGIAKYYHRVDFINW